VETFGRQNGLPPDALFSLNLVLEELFTNALKHGGCVGLAAAARVSLDARGGEIAVEFADRGAAFDPASAPAPDFSSSLADRQPGGLGLHFVRQLAREVAYRRSGEWNRVALRLPLAPAPSNPDL